MQVAGVVHEELIQLCKMGDIHMNLPFTDNYENHTEQQLCAHMFWQFGDLDTMLNACAVTAGLDAGGVNNSSINKQQLQRWARNLGVKVQNRWDPQNLVKRILDA